MARKPRIHFPGAFYHVIVRGNQRQKTFRSRLDYTRYLELLKQYQQRYGFRLYAYVLMSNHVHMLIETGKIPLSKSMQGLQQSYTGYFNRKYHLVGHLFQGRYKAIVCDRDEYLLQLTRYLHLNPVRSNIVRDPALYAWGSHRVYMGKASAEKPSVEVDLVLSQFSRNRKEAIRRYRLFVQEGMDEGHREDLYATKEQRYLGGDEFVEKVTQEAPIEEPRRARIELRDIEEAVCHEYPVSVENLRSMSKEPRGAVGRVMVAYIGQERAGIKLRVVAERYGRDQASLSLGVKRLRERLKEDARLRRSLENAIRWLRKTKGRELNK